MTILRDISLTRSPHHHAAFAGVWIIAYCFFCSVGQVFAHPVIIADGTGCPKEAENRAKKHFKQAQTYSEQQKVSEAVAAYKQAFDLCPLPRILYNIGVVYWNHGMRMEALHWYEHYIKLKSDSPSGKQALAQFFALAEEFYRAGAYEESRALFRRYRRLPISTAQMAYAEMRLDEMEGVPAKSVSADAAAAEKRARDRFSYRIGFWSSVAAVVGSSVALGIFGVQTRRFERDAKESLMAYQDRTGQALNEDDMCADAEARVRVGDDDADLRDIVNACHRGSRRSRATWIAGGTLIASGVVAGILLYKGYLQGESDADADKDATVEPILSATSIGARWILKF